MIKTIFFDLGKVLVDFDWAIPVKKMAEKSTAGENEIYHFITKSPEAMGFEKGEIHAGEFFQIAKKEIGFKNSEDELHFLWSDIFVPIHEHLALVEKLSGHYPLGMISNTNEAHIQWIEKQCNFFKFFSAKVFSYETGFLKPEKQIYELALKSLETNSSEALFIDDLEANILGAKSLGWKTIHLKNGVNLSDELKAEGIIF